MKNDQKRYPTAAILGNMQFTIDKHKVFPYIAWVVVISFAAYAIYVTEKVEADLERLKTERAQQQQEYIDPSTSTYLE